MRLRTQGLEVMAAGSRELESLAFMRGRMLNDAFVILDEEQNATSEQMEVFLTRLGLGSKTVVTGDFVQINLPGGKSGLVEASMLVRNVSGLGFKDSDDKNVVRHRLVQEIIRSYERAGATGHGEISQANE